MCVYGCHYICYESLATLLTFLFKEITIRKKIKKKAEELLDVQSNCLGFSYLS